MNNLQQFLLDNPVDDLRAKVVVSQRLHGFEFEIKAISNEEFAEFQTRCVENPTSPKKRKFNARKFNELVVIHGTVEPNFKDAEFIKQSNCVDSAKLLYKVLLPGEITFLAEKILELSGFNNDIEEELEEAKN